MEGAKEKTIVNSLEFFQSVDNIYQYGINLFGEFQAIKYESLIYEEVRLLPLRYLAHPECRHISTKSRMYHSIILPAHFILYRALRLLE